MLLWRVLTGRPLRLSEARREQIEPLEGLPALSLDALTSVAYGPEAIMVSLAAAGAGALHLVLPITVAIVVLLAILVFSYLQVIDAYPHGGGAYAVAKGDLGKGVSELAAASLVVDYTLTVAVSIAAGVASLVSAFPALSGEVVPLCIGILALVTVLNLRGLGDAARAFLLPTMVFIVGIFVVIVVGLVHPLALHVPQPGRSTVPTEGLEAVGVLLVLKAFAAGCSALTGVEAIANGVPQFRPPSARHAKQTELLLGGILGAMLLGLAVLAVRFHVGPRSSQTILSQIIATSLGRHGGYFVVELATTVVLALAANTSFGGLPLLGSLLARDRYLPQAFRLRSERLVFNVGILALALLSGSLLVAVGGNTVRLIPLFAIGVFTGFTVSQTGLVLHWRRARPPGWRRRAAINLLGAITTATATVIFLFTKFTEGAWIVVVAVPLLVLAFRRVRRYYARVAMSLHMGELPGRPEPGRSVVVVPLTERSAFSALGSRALSEALTLGSEVVAVTVELEGGSSPSRPDSMQEEWRSWDPGVPLVVLRTPVASVSDPFVRFVDDLRAKDPGRLVVVLIPMIEPARLRQRLFHNHLDLVLSRALSERDGVIVSRMRMPVDV
jgi:amino acid transporter